MNKNLLGFLALTISACSGNVETDQVVLGDPAYENRLMEQLLDAQPGDVILIPEGKFPMTRSLSLTVDGVTIRGQGMDKSILSFTGQVAGAEGLLVTASDFTIEGLAIEDTVGDALKINEGENIIIRGVRTEWTGGYKTENGAYGIYPVQTSNVLMEDNVAIGASDAGIYVGQSSNVIVRRNRAEYNVAGIEIENTLDADVYENVATNNTGGILVFNMPNLPQEGKRTRVFRNEVVSNNTPNFGHEGTPVASVPAGSGIVISSNDQVEVFENFIAHNETANIIIASVYSSNFADMNAQPNYDPYPEGIFIYDNTLEGGGSSPDGLDLAALKVVMFGLGGSFPDVIWDGFLNREKLIDGQQPEDARICIDNGDISLLNVDAPNDYANPRIQTDEHMCALPQLTPVTLTFSDL